MAINLTCLNIYPSLPVVPLTANDSNNTIHPAYKPDSGGLSQIISASLARSTFSNKNVESLLNKLFEKNFDLWKVSEIMETKPIPAIITYTSIALALFVIFSIIFCVTSCLNFNKHNSNKKQPRQSKTTNVCVCLLIIVYLLGIGDMIYVAIRVNKSKLSIDDTIKEINRDIYPREISEHMQYLIKQSERLDQYLTQPNSILINASKSMLVTTFNDILKEIYFIEDIHQTINSIDKHIRDLNVSVNEEPKLSDLAKELFQQIQQQYQYIINYVELPLKEICNYASETETDIDKILLVALEVVHLELNKVIDVINKDILSEITPWQSHMFMNSDLEEQVLFYAGLVGTIFMVLVIVLGVIPLVFFVIVMISRFCCRNRDNSSKHKYDRFRLGTVSGPSSMDDRSNSDDYPRYKSGNRQSSKGTSKMSKKQGSSKVLLCWMRIEFGLMVIILFVMTLVTGVYYGLDLVAQGSCRTVHDDQPFLINFITEKLIESNVMFVDSSEMNTTITNVINDCRNHVHFSRKLLESYWSTLDRNVNDMMNTLNKQIHDKFITSIDNINITGDIDLLVRFVNQANISNIPDQVKSLNTDLNTMQIFFGNISKSSSTLPQNFVQTTINGFNEYVMSVLESTVDSCPLPLATIYKTDTLVCHTLGGSINGLWLSVLIFMSLTTVGLCIFGVCVYKRLNVSFKPAEKQDFMF